MPDASFPGVFIEEMSRREPAIEGVPTDVVALIGDCARGPSPTDDAPAPIVTSPHEFARRFETPGDHPTILGDAVRAFFENGGRRCHVVRIARPGSAAARASVLGGTPFLAVARGAGDWGNALTVTITPGAEATLVDATVTDTTTGIVEHWTGIPPTALAATINERSELIRVEAATDLDPPPAPTGVPIPLVGGLDGEAPDDGAMIAAIGHLARLDDVMLIAAPGATSPAVHAALARGAESMRGLAILDGERDPSMPDPVASILAHRSTVTSTCAAYYAPWIEATPAPGPAGPTRTLPPSGFVAGIIARVHGERGVGKSPANEIVRGAAALHLDITAAMQERLNPAGVNCIRVLPGRGIRVWGARTTSGDPEWRFLGPRCLALFLERSIDRGVRWAVFEPHVPATWARLRAAVESFLLSVWRSGDLLGARPEEAFFVRCDASTMTDDDVRRGRLIALVGVATTTPAEFVVLRFDWPMASG